MRRLSSTAGFTLIEIMVVVFILGLLVTLVAPKILGKTDQARQVKARADIKAIEDSLHLFKLDNGFYPTTDQGLAALVQKPAANPVPGNWKQGGYLERLPRDPWGSDYQFLNPGVKGEIDVFSLGADRARGGEGSGADIGSWE